MRFLSGRQKFLQRILKPDGIILFSLYFVHVGFIRTFLCYANEIWGKMIL